MYLPDATDFTDIEKRQPFRGCTYECPVCHGHGKWNLTLNAYGPGKHFQACCSQCNGWGYVAHGGPDAICVHDYEEQPATEMFLHVYKCKKCDHKISTDSSD